MFSSFDSSEREATSKALQYLNVDLQKIKQIIWPSIKTTESSMDAADSGGDLMANILKLSTEDGSELCLVKSALDVASLSDESKLLNKIKDKMNFDDFQPIHADSTGDENTCTAKSDQNDGAHSLQYLNVDLQKIKQIIWPSIKTTESSMDAADSGGDLVPVKQPPQRPAPPVKPPPPQRPSEGPIKPIQKSTAVPLKKIPAVRQPLGSKSINNIKNKSKQPKVSSIGLPTNVSHHGHAGNMEEAQNLIEKLIRGESVDSSLPQPLQPNNNELGLPTQISQSRTSDALSLITESPNSELNVHRSIPRAKSTGNITGVENPVPTPRLRDSPTDDNNVPVPRPRPAPRRDIQSAFVNSDFQENLHQRSSELNQIEPVESGISHTEGNLFSHFLYMVVVVIKHCHFSFGSFFITLLIFTYNIVCFIEMYFFISKDHVGVLN